MFPSYRGTVVSGTPRNRLDPTPGNLSRSLEGMAPGVRPSGAGAASATGVTLKSRLKGPCGHSERLVDSGGLWIRVKSLEVLRDCTWV